MAPDTAAFQAVIDHQREQIRLVFDPLLTPYDAPNAIEYEQSDGQVYLLCKISEVDATGLGMFTSAAARSP